MNEFMTAFSVSLQSVWNDSGFSAITSGNIIMMVVGCLLLYMAFVKEYEPLLLSPIAFGCILANFPKTGFNDEMNVMMAIGFGIKYEIFPPIIFTPIRCFSALPLSSACSSLWRALCFSASTCRKRLASVSSAARTARRQFI